VVDTGFEAKPNPAARGGNLSLVMVIVQFEASRSLAGGRPATGEKQPGRLLGAS